MTAILRLDRPIDLLSLHCTDPQRYPFLLETVATAGEGVDLLLALPGARLSWSGNGLDARGWHPPAGADFFGALSSWAAEECTEEIAEVPFCGGWFLLLGYEAVRCVEPGLRLPPSPFDLPDALAVRCRAAVIRHRHTGALTLIAEDETDVPRLIEDCRRMPSGPDTGSSVPRIGPIRESDPRVFLKGVRRIIEYLRAGDVFQVNLSRRWSAPMPAFSDYVSVYRRLRRHNPAPFAGLVHLGGRAVLSSSPERLLRIERGIARTRPIAGTHARAIDDPLDRRQRESLMGSLKERAEHIMLIDLERNDLGRVCEPGSVVATELMALESYAHVHHIVSEVSGRLRPEIGPGEALRAVFPGGTITGCPKIRAMEIIGELEGEGRGPYTGAMGYLSRCGRLDTNILIRSLVCGDGQVSLRAGAGIVADSKPETELAETRAKARGPLMAIETA